MSTNVRNINSRNSRNSSSSSSVALTNADQRRNPTRTTDDEKEPSTTNSDSITNRSLATVVRLDEKKFSSGTATARMVPSYSRLEENPSRTLATTKSSSNAAIRQRRYSAISEDENHVLGPSSGSFETLETGTETPPRETLTLAEESNGTSSALPSSMPPRPVYNNRLPAEEDFNRWPNAEERTNAALVVSEESESSLESGIDTRNLYGDRENLENWVLSTLDYRSPIEDDFEIGSIGDSDQHDIGDFERMDQNR